MSQPRTVRAVSFDYGQTLGELDTTLLATRVAERGATLSGARAEAAVGGAWEAYGEAKSSGLQGREAWLTFMETLLSTAGMQHDSAGGVETVAAWLWDEQPRLNLWRRPIAGCMELVRALGQQQIGLAILSNSEGRLEELLVELGQRDAFQLVADSGRLGYEKPDPRIFEYVADGLDTKVETLLHIGDSWAADIEGALAVGASAVWFGPQETERALPEGVYRARNAVELRSVLSGLGLLPG